jgi:hypothetical protein
LDPLRNKTIEPETIQVVCSSFAVVHEYAKSVESSLAFRVGRSRFVQLEEFDSVCLFYDSNSCSSAKEFEETYDYLTRIFFKLIVVVDTYKPMPGILRPSPVNHIRTLKKYRSALMFTYQNEQEFALYRTVQLLIRLKRKTLQVYCLKNFT